MTGCFPFHWMNVGEMGSIEAVTVSCSGFVLLAPISELLGMVQSASYSG